MSVLKKDPNPTINVHHSAASTQQKASLIRWWIAHTQPFIIKKHNFLIHILLTDPSDEESQSFFNTNTAKQSKHNNQKKKKVNKTQRTSFNNRLNDFSLGLTGNILHRKWPHHWPRQPIQQLLWVPAPCTKADEARQRTVLH